MKKENYCSLFVCSPQNFKMITPINYTEQKTFQSGIDTGKLVKEHDGFCRLLTARGVRVLSLPLLPNCPQQTFVRDLGFSLQSTLYIGNSLEPLRAGEHKALIEVAQDLSLPTYRLQHHLEGGDVVVFGHTVFVGISGRTQNDAAQELKTILPRPYTLVSVPIQKRFLHLDTVLGCVGNLLVINPSGFDSNFDPHRHAEHVLEIPPAEQVFLATNFIALNDHTILSNQKCNRLNAALRDKGITVWEYEFDELLKLGGSFRCCTLEIPQRNK